MNKSILLSIILSGFTTCAPAFADAYADGCAKYQAADYKAAAEKFEAAVKAKPSDWKAHYQLGNCYVSLKNPTAAVQAYEDCIKYKPTDDVRKNCEQAITFLLKNPSGLQTASRPAAAAAPTQAAVSTPASASTDAAAKVASSAKSDDSGRDADIDRHRTQIMADANARVEKVRAELKETIEQMRANGNQYYKYPDGTVRTDANPEDVARVTSESEKECEKILEEARRRAASVR